MYYVPLSIQLPSHVSALMSKQAVFEAQCAERTATAAAALERLQQQQRQVEEEHYKSFHHVTQLDESGQSGRGLEEEEGLEGLLVSAGNNQDSGGLGERQQQLSPTDGDVQAQISEALASELQSASNTDPSALANTVSSPDQVLKTSSASAPGSVPSLGSSTQHQQQQQDQETPCIPPSPASGVEVFSSIEAGRQKYADSSPVAQPQGGVVVSQPVKTSDTHPIK